MEFYSALLAWAAEPGFSPLQAVRIALALVALPFLYRALQERPEEPSSEPTSAARRVRPLVFAVLGAGVLYLLTDRWSPAPTPSEPGRGFQSFSSGVLYYRLGFSQMADLVPPPDEKPSHRAAGVEQLRAAVKQLPKSVYLRRYLGIALAERGQYEAALAELEEATEVLSERAPQRARDELAIWQAFFGPQKPSREAIDAHAARLRAFNLGWIGKVGLLAAYQRVGANVPELRSEVRQGAGTYVRRLSTAGMIVLLLIPQLALIAVVVGGVLISDRVLQPAPKAYHATAPILLESFILMLALGMVPGWIAFPGGREGRPAPETQPTAFAWLLIAADLFQLLALGYLWLRLRQRGLGLEEIGLSRRGLGANILIGVVAAAVVIPGAYFLGFFTQWVGERYFPSIAPPYHPLGILTATSSSWEIRGALFVGAVIGAPFLEEIFFRGALFGALRRRRNFWTALLASSAFFSILHPQLPLGFVPIAALGGAFAALYEWRQSLVPGMVAHALNNSIPFLMLNLMFPASG